MENPAEKGQLEHPNIVPVYELGYEETNAPYMVMKKVRGRGLDRVLVGISETGFPGPGVEGLAAGPAPLDAAERRGPRTRRSPLG